MKQLLLIFGFCFFVGSGSTVWGENLPVSEATEECIGCHAVFHPGIVEGWRAGRHAKMTPQKARNIEGLALKVSSETIPQGLSQTVVGCAECHTMRSEAHADTFEHNGYQVHVVVSPDDCRTCHAEEADQYSRNLMSHAVKNLAANKVYNQLQRTILGSPVRKDGNLTFTPESDLTEADGCYYCHGTTLKVEKTEVRETDVGELEFPIIAGWPNQGVGRINLDGSRGSCTACHPRHQFSMAMARKPSTCKECHVGPDVPSNKVYETSKHGSLYASLHDSWDFKKTPWTIGRDFTAPTCATCHISLVVTEDGDVLNKRTHQMTDRLAWRIFGLIYAHPQPKSPDVSIIRNRDNQPLPTDLSGGEASAYLIDEAEQKRRTASMQTTCLGCHSQSWVNGYWKRYNHVIRDTDQTVKVLTEMMQEAWQKGYAKGFDQGKNPFDEMIERKWSNGWLFYGNTVRFSAAMAGGGDYSVFANGFYRLSETVFEMHQWLKEQDRLQSLSRLKAK